MGITSKENIIKSFEPTAEKRTQLYFQILGEKLPHQPLFNNIVYDLVIEILKYLDTKSLFACSLVCKDLLYLCNLPSIWKGQTLNLLDRSFQTLVKRVLEDSKIPQVEDISNFSQTKPHLNIWKEYYYYIKQQIQLKNVT